jgi:hypothetical protein
LRVRPRRIPCGLIWTAGAAGARSYEVRLGAFIAGRCDDVEGSRAGKCEPLLSVVSMEVTQGWWIRGMNFRPGGPRPDGRPEGRRRAAEDFAVAAMVPVVEGTSVDRRARSGIGRLSRLAPACGMSRASRARIGAAPP